MERTKPSVYLGEKVANFLQTMEFFRGIKGSHWNPGKERRLIFLSQIDFWEWELETLIYSFQQFEERSKAWSGDIQTHLLKMGVMVRPKIIDEMNQLRAWRTGNDVVAPVEDLNKCIERWNSLLDLCVDTLFSNMAEKTARTDSNFLANLDKFKKKPFISTPGESNG